MKKKITTLSILLLLCVLSPFSFYAFGQVYNASVASGDTIMYEGFNYSTGKLPSGWTLDGTDAPWSITNSSLAGGNPPELYLGYSFATGYSRLISPVINVEGCRELSLNYKQYLINYDMDFGEIIGLDITFDGGQNWESLWDIPLGLSNIPQSKFTRYITVPDGAKTLQIAYRYEGNSYAINFWTIDDIVLKKVPDNDLSTVPSLGNSVAFIGNTTPKVGEQNFYFIEVVNAGKLSQSNYTVKLMGNGGVELASVPGQTIAFGEKAGHALFWTPTEDDINNITSIYGQVEFAQDEVLANNISNPVSLNIQPASTLSVQLGSGSSSVFWLPYNFWNTYNLSQTLYFAEELGNNKGNIRGLQYTCQFDVDTKDVPIQIYLGETDKTDLADGWIDPSTLSLVFDGKLDFSKGFNNKYISFNTTYQYKGKNLVVYSNKGKYERPFSVAHFICTIDSFSNRSRIAEGDDQPYNSNNPPAESYTSDSYPNVTFFYTPVSTAVDKVNAVSINMYPNPVSNILNIETDKTIYKISLINTLGQIVYQKNINNSHHKINVSELNSGVYFVEVITSEGLTSGKVIISK